MITDVETERRQELTAWMSKQIGLGATTAPLRFFKLSNSLNGRIGLDIDTWEIDKNNPEEVSELAAQVFDRARQDAHADGGGTRQYYLTPYFGKEGDPHASKRYQFYVRTPERDAAEGDVSMTPSRGRGVDASMQVAENVIAQTFRHQERKEAMLAASQMAVINSLQRHNERLAAEVEGSNERTLEMVRVYAEMMDDKERREAERRQLEAQEKVKMQMWSQIGNLLPIAASKLTGIPMGNGASSGQSEAQGALIKSLLQSLQPEQAMMLQQNLTMDQQMIIMRLMEMNKEQEVAKAEVETGKSASSLLQIAPAPAQTEK